MNGRRLGTYGIILMILSGLWGCVSIPQREWQAYNDVFKETKDITGQVLLEFDKAKLAEEKKKSTKVDTDGKKETKTSYKEYPHEVDITSTVQGRNVKSDLDYRFDALLAISNYNSLLTALAEGKNIEDVKSISNSLINNINKLTSSLFSNEILSISGNILATIVAKLTEANNREQFIATMKITEPIIQDILLLFAKDGEDFYRLKALQSDRMLTEYQDNVATALRNIKNILREYLEPSGLQKSRLDEVQTKMRKIYDSVELTENKEILVYGTGKILDELIISYIEQCTIKANDDAIRYRVVIDTQVALYKLIVSYSQLLAKTKVALSNILVLINEPIDIAQQTYELSSFIFSVKRDLDALDKAGVFNL